MFLAAVIPISIIFQSASDAPKAKEIIQDDPVDFEGDSLAAITQVNIKAL